ncbi:MAG TPA: adenylyltransferase/cytidyltransferase family protein [Bacteroidia bacterium]|nr:adenylyltransferase/cytidyltransferase family protein [Bacteroidia bacterium]
METTPLSSLDIIRKKIFVVDTLQRTVALWRMKSKKIIFTNGCFDILHLGHIDYLAKAADLADELIVAVNSDISVKMLEKGSSRPIQDEDSRAMIIASLHFVSAVILFDEKNPLQLIQQIMPDILVKGADYDANETDSKNKKYIIGSDVIRKNKGEVKTIPFLDGFSTSLIEKKIKNN